MLASLSEIDTLVHELHHSLSLLASLDFHLPQSRVCDRRQSFLIVQNTTFNLFFKAVLFFIHLVVILYSISEPVFHPLDEVTIETTLPLSQFILRIVLTLMLLLSQQFVLFIAKVFFIDITSLFGFNI